VAEVGIILRVEVFAELAGLSLSERYATRFERRRRGALELNLATICACG